MKKRLIAILLAITLFLSAIPSIAAEAEEHPAHAYVVELIRKHLNESELVINDFFDAAGFTSPVMRISFDWRDGNESIRASYHNPPDKSRSYTAYPVNTLDKISFFNYVMNNYSTISSHLPAGVELHIEIFEADGSRTILDAAACLEWAAKADGSNDGSEESEVTRLTAQETYDAAQKALDMFTTLTNDVTTLIEESITLTLTPDTLPGYEQRWKTFADTSAAIQKELDETHPALAYESSWSTLSSFLSQVTECLMASADLDTNGDGIYTSAEMSAELNYSANTFIKLSKQTTGIFNDLLQAIKTDMESQGSADNPTQLIENPLVAYQSVQVGETLLFGHYEQDCDLSTGQEPIEWQVLAKDGTKVLLISRYGLDCQPYNETWAEVTWEKCTLRTWLNDDFLQKAFNTTEQSAILTTTVSAHKNSSYKTDPGNDTQDKVFLLSEAEAESYFKSDVGRHCKPTEYAVDLGVYVSERGSDKGNCYWWLRTPGEHPDEASMVLPGGGTYCWGSTVNRDYYSVRPVLWVDLKPYLQVTVSQAEQASTTEVHDYRVGDIVSFGKYEQDDSTANGREAIEWIVLAEDDDKVLLLSQYVLDEQPYNETVEEVTWETCTLRTWLNLIFMNKAFNATEQASILTTTVSADKNPRYDTNPGNATQDKVFLLSVTEAESYFTSDEERQCQPTAHAVELGVYVSKDSDDRGNCYWWLRTPGEHSDEAVQVGTGGGVYTWGATVDGYFNPVRPALWVDKNSPCLTLVKAAPRTNDATSEAALSSKEDLAVQPTQPPQNSLTAYQAIQVGETMFFGHYEQDNDKANGQEPIEWLVLERNDNKVLLISRYVLANSQYHSVENLVTWETCGLRFWLNNTFMNAAFSKAEQSAIMTTRVWEMKHISVMQGTTDPGNATNDKVFLLSIDQANEYFADSDSRIAQSAQSVHSGYANGNVAWWLRSPGDFMQWNAAYVSKYGSANKSGQSVSYVAGVRPVLWLDLTAGGF